MNLKETLQLAWNNRAQIADGLYNKFIEHREDIDKEAERRKAICESNVCGHYDPIGKPETSAIPGKPACDICFCNIDVKVHCTFCWCALKDIQQPPLWEELLTQEQHNAIAQKVYESQFNK